MKEPAATPISDPNDQGPAGARSESVVFVDPTAIQVISAGLQKEFPRPATPLNRVLAGFAERLPQRRLEPLDIRRWLSSSLEVFSILVEDPAALGRIERETAWLLSDEEPPDPDVWSGECKFAENGPPIVVCYSTTLASRLPRAAFEIAWQGAMDHFVGHLYPFFRGARSDLDYGEEVACRYQHLAAQYRGRRDRRYKLVAWLMPLTYRLHKQIPLANYARLSDFAARG